MNGETINYLDRAEEWYKRAQKEEDFFIKFILLYISLEVIIKLKELKGIRSLKNRTNLIGNLKEIDLQSLIDILSKKPLKNEHRNQSDDWNGKIKDTDDWDGVIEFLARARNNLFHGDKGLDNERDTFIVTWGNKLLNPIVKVLLEEERPSKTP